MELDKAVTLIKGVLDLGVHRIAIDSMCKGTDWIVTIYKIEDEAVGTIDNVWQLVIDSGLDPWTDFEEGVTIR